MPTAITEITSKVQEQLLDALRAGQDAVVDTVTSVAGTVERVLPEPAKGTLAFNLPLATEAADQAFGFAEKVLDAQHRFVTRVLSALTPEDGTAASKPAPKAAAKTSTANAAA
ncbi:MAG TPA: hypothetical protein VFW24_06375 [Acidimicrobiales bacterium]|nr:hypothetical protein [Acidimicrobiales bacterium]